MRIFREDDIKHDEEGQRADHDCKVQSKRNCEAVQSEAEHQDLHGNPRPILNTAAVSPVIFEEEVNSR